MSEAVVLEENINDIPLDQIAPADPTRFQQNTIFPMFARIREEDPVHYTSDSPWGAYWSITKFEDIIAIDNRCMGNRLAEMQLRILWEEILERFEKVELVGTETRNLSNFVRGITDLPVVLHAKK